MEYKFISILGTFLQESKTENDVGWIKNNPSSCYH
jgi:hypothetical protein